MGSSDAAITIGRCELIGGRKDRAKVYASSVAERALTRSRVIKHVDVTSGTPMLTIAVITPVALAIGKHGVQVVLGDGFSYSVLLVD